MCHYWHAQPSEGYLLAKIINTKIVEREVSGGGGGGGSQGLSNEFAAMRSEAGQCALKGVKAVSRYCPSSQQAISTLTCLTGPVCSLLGLW